MKPLGQVGDREAGDVGSGPVRKPRALRPAEAVALRVAEFVERDDFESTVDLKDARGRRLEARPLNEGFFLLERMRAEQTAKARDARKGKVRSR